MIQLKLKREAVAMSDHNLTQLRIDTFDYDNSSAEDPYIWCDLR